MNTFVVANKKICQQTSGPLALYINLVIMVYHFTNFFRISCLGCIAFFLVFFDVQVVTGQAFPDRHSTSKQDAWISCSTSPSPNEVRGEGHWILYDFGETYALQQSVFWNLSNPEYFTAAARDMVIDYSIDGVTWVEFGRFSVDDPSASAFYQGHEGPDFGGLVTRFLLITILSNHGGECSGFSELKIDAKPSLISKTNDLDDLAIQVFPNPFVNEVWMKWNRSDGQDLHYRLTDILGRTIRQGQVTESPLRLSNLDIAPGVYLLTLIHPSGVKSFALEKLN